jgi:predicted SnoaL-like aldol condensation-catalyzing enzyme
MSSAAQPISTLEKNKQILIRWFEEVWNQGRRETIFELFPAGILNDGSAQLNGPEEFSSFYDALHSQFSDFRFSPGVSLAEGDLACLHWSVEFCHTVSGKALNVTGTTIVRVENGVFAEAWQNWDAASLGAQLSGQLAAPLW